ncbi:MAG: hypothetical protein QG608_1634 [Actinomycetota bacterium]|nr:hypothetical protein [Actinomycetota bacterium]
MGKNRLGFGRHLKLTGFALASAALVFGATPAQADGTSTKSGWYSKQPLNLDVCGQKRQLAVGGDKKPMTAYACVTKTGRKQAQGVIVFENSSTSTATAVGEVTVRGYWYDMRVSGPTYTCGGKTLPAKGRLYCVGHTALFDSPDSYGVSGETDGNATVNGYGGDVSSGKVKIFQP